MALFIEPVAGGATTGYGYVPGVHLSLDFEVPVGTVVVAAADGQITNYKNNGAMGDTIFIKHAGGYETRYGNIGTFTAKVGQKVEQGQGIGTSDGRKNSRHPGDSSGPHLPFQVWRYGVPVNPKSVTAGATDAKLASDTTSSSSGFLNPFGAFDQVGSWVSNPGNWVRVGLGMIGGTLVLIALIKVLSTTQAGQAAIANVKSTVKEAGKTAEVAALA
jgi:murein DD-endopeptidase MepM/ murein hydrolase activator NlpD